MSLFVDTSIWYAAADKSDVNNESAKKILSGDEVLITTDHVLVETWTLIRSRLSRRASERCWAGLREGAARLEVVNAADLESAREICAIWKDQDFSFVDRTSIAVMRRLGIDRVASLAEDFAIFRFGPNRRRACTVVR